MTDANRGPRVSTWRLGLLLLGILGCGQAGKTASAPVEKTQPPAIAATATEPAAKPGPLSVTDGLGRAVTVPAVPSRIVSLSPKNTEVLFAVGAGGQVVGVTTQCNFPPEAKEREQVGGFSAESLSIEKIVGLQPDLVVSAGDIHQPVIAQLESLKVPVVALSAESLAGLYGEIELLGDVTGHGATARKLIEQLQQRVARVKDRTEGIPPEKRVTVYYQVWDNPLMAAGPASFVGELIELSGGNNIVRDPAARYPKLSEEVVLSQDPEVILAPSMQPGQVTREQFTGRPGWGDVRAVKNERIYLLEGDLVSRCGPRLVDALEMMSQSLYPERAP